MCKQIKGRVWCPRQESNLYLALRRRSFYPLNYGGSRTSLFAQHAHGIFQALEGERKHAIADQLLKDADADADALAVLPLTLSNL